METGLRNRVALIAGASQGLGRATALAFAAEGSHVAICSRDLHALEELAAEIRGQFGVEVQVGKVDVRDRAAIERFAGEAQGRFNRLDICVANAGGPPAKQFLETTDEEWDDAFRLNLRSAAALARAAIPYMQRKRWGRIITITSITVRQPQPQLVLSNAIRAGVMGLVRTLATDFGKDGITVNNIAPGYTATDRLNELIAHRAATSGENREQIEKAWTDEIPVGRLGKPEEIADAIVWLASERASFVTGQTVLVDGGMYKGL
jgi:3-oxoacyl-[acyl-carrier protein] reductase